MFMYILKGGRHMSHEKVLLLENLNCAHCAAKIEDRVSKLKNIKNSSLNFTAKTLNINIEDLNNSEETINDIKDIVSGLEPDVTVKEKKQTYEKYLILEGLVCTSCGQKIEEKTRAFNGVKNSNINYTNGKLSIELDDPYQWKNIKSKAKSLIAQIEPDVNIIDMDEDLPSNTIKRDNISVLSLNKSKLIRFSIGGLLFILALFTDTKIPKLSLFISSYILTGGDIVLRALKNILRGNLFDENFLMSIATLGAFAIGEYPEAVAVMLFYQTGEMFQDMAVTRSRRSIKDLMDIKPEYANIKKGNNTEKVSPESVNIDDIIVIKPGEKVPLDGIVVSGSSMMDTSPLTGESVPRKINVEDAVLSGFINTNGVLEVKVKKTFANSTVSKILELVENAGSKKAPTEKFMTKFSKYYTPVVVFSALALAVIPPLILQDASFSHWLYRALIFLVVSCPCALVVSIPLSFFGGIGGASKKGVLIKGGNFLEALNNAHMVVFDKTGTLTKGNFNVSSIVTKNNISKDSLLKFAAYSESYSNHPIAKSITKYYGKTIDESLIKDYKEISGHGIEAIIDGKKVAIGNNKLMKMNNIDCDTVNTTGTVVHLAIDNIYSGYIIISDTVKEDSRNAIQGIKDLGIKKTIMLTGDNKTTAENISKKLGIDEVYSELLPEGKVDIIEKLDSQKPDKSKIVFVGDGINDAPVLARADIGVSMGALGSDAAIEAADIVLMTDEPSKLIDAFKVARKTRKIVYQNIGFSLGIKLIVLIMGAIGMANMWEAVFADVGVALIAVLNSLRVLNVKNID